jgi:hypothetical protein
MVTQVGYSVAGQSRDQVTLCAVCTWHVRTRSVGFFVEPQNQGRWFGLKTTRTVFTGLASKLVATVSDGLASKPAATVSSGLASKPAATVFSSLASKLVVGFLVEPQNQGGGGFSGWASKPAATGLVIWASKSSRRFLGLDLKTK